MLNARPVILETRIWEVQAIFDVVDGFAQQRGLSGRNPRPMGDVAFYAVAEVINGQRVYFAEPLRLIVQQNPSGYFLFFGKVQRGKGMNHRDLLRSGTYVLRVVSDYYLTHEQPDEVIPMAYPTQTIPIALMPSTAYPYPQTVKLLRGTLRHVDGSGMADVAISAAVDGQQVQYVTGANGDWVLTLPHSTRGDAVPQNLTLDVKFNFPDGSEHIRRIPDIRYQPSMVVNVRLQSAIVGQVVDQNGRGATGVVVEVPNQWGRVVTDQEGWWTFVFTNQAADTTIDSIVTDGQQQLFSPVVIPAGETRYAPRLKVTRSF